MHRQCPGRRPGTDIGAFEVQQPCPVALPLVNVGVVSGHFGFDVAGGSNQVVVAEAYTNLVNWTALATNTLGASPLPLATLIGQISSSAFTALNLSHEPELRSCEVAGQS